MENVDADRIVQKLLQLSNNDFVSFTQYIDVAEQEDLNDEELAAIILRCNDAVILSGVAREINAVNTE